MRRRPRFAPAAALAGLLLAPPVAATQAPTGPAQASAPTALSATAPEPSPYVDHRSRAIKALSAEQVRAYLAGEGMGLALPAELNGYPGPKHVLELAAGLELRPEQTRQVEEIQGRMRAEAVRLGEEVVELERRLDESFAGGRAEPAALREALDRLGRLHGELRFAHLRAHLETRDLLSPDQLAAYARLRGYGEDAGGGHGGHDGHGGHGGHGGARHGASSEVPAGDTAHGHDGGR